MNNIILQLTVPGNPVPCPRPRVVRIKNFVRAFIPKPARDYISMVEWLITVENRKKTSPHDALLPFGLTATFYRSDKRRCDMDNMLKSLMDAITNAEIWNDDSQLIEASLKKRYDKTNPRVEFELYRPEPEMEIKQIEEI